MSSQSDCQTKQVQRTSFYLVQKSDTLLSALQFFSSSESTDKRRRLQFLAQSDFWEWELDNLIYSFTTLVERQKTWSSPRAREQKLIKLGMVIDSRVITGVSWRRGHWRAQQKDVRHAPLDRLAAVVSVWNGLIDQAEKEFIEPMLPRAKKFNIQMRSDLSSLRREMPTGLVGLDDDGELVEIGTPTLE